MFFLQVLEYQARELHYEEELSSRADKIRSPYSFYTFSQMEACTMKKNFIYFIENYQFSYEQCTDKKLKSEDNFPHILR